MADWVRFQHYARRVQVLCVQSEEEEEPEWATDLSAYAALQRFHSGRILPNLVHCEWNYREAGSYVMLFFQPTLKTLQFLPGDPDDVCLVLQAIGKAAPNLQVLRLNDEDYFMLKNLRPDHSAALQTLHHLTTLHIENVLVLEDAFVHLSRLPNLHSFHVVLSDENRNSWSKPSWARFPALRNLRIRSSGDVLERQTETMVSFLGSISTVTLNELNIEGDQSSDLLALRNLFAVVGTFAHLGTLHIIFDSDMFSQQRSWGEQYLEGSVLAPLQALKLVEKFYVESVPIAIRSEDVRGLATAWRYLQFFKLIPGRTAHSRLDIEHLSHFAEHCQRLRELAVDIFPPTPEWAWNHSSHPTLSPMPSLNLLKSRLPPASAHQIAEYLADVFPLATVSHDFGPRAVVPRDIVEAMRVMKAIAKIKEGLVNNPRGAAASAS